MAGMQNIMEPAAGDDGPLDATTAATLLASTRRDARRDFEQRGPLICVFTALVLLSAYGLLWLSVRGQHPYIGPSGAVVAWVYTVVGVSIAVTVTAYRRAVSGVHGRSRHEDIVAAVVVGLPWACVYVFNGALHVDGFGPNLVYGVFDAAGPWLVVGAASAALAAGREQWGRTAGGLIAVLLGTGAAFAGPIGCWGVLAVGGCAGFLGLAVVQYIRLQRA